MPDTVLDEASLAGFLDAFYARVRRDPLVGPVFAAAIPEPDWPRHMAVIRDFWSSVLLKSGRYKGNPFGRHQALGVLTPEHFARWLGLFEATAAERFTPELAAALVGRAPPLGASRNGGRVFPPDLVSGPPS